MKVIIAADIYPPDIGGPATYASFLHEHLPDHHIEVTVVCYSDQPGTDVVRVVRSGLRVTRYLRYCIAVIKVARDADVIYAMGPVSAGLPASWAAKLLRKPLLVKVVGDYAWEQARNNGSTALGIDEFQTKTFGGKIGQLRRIEKKVCQQAKKVIVPSEYLKKIVSGWGIAGDKIDVIYNGVASVPSSRRSAAGTTIVSIGRLVPWKGFSALITLMPDLLTVYPDLKLEIYGSGPDGPELQRLIHQLKLGRSVSIMQVNHKEVLRRLANARMLVLNTGYEGFAHTILEAMMVGTPVVTTTAGGNPEIITDGKDGLLFTYNHGGELKAAISRLLADSNLHQSIVSNAKRSSQRFSVETMLTKTITMLQSV